MYEKLILWIKENWIEDNDIYTFEKSIYKKMQYFNQDKTFIETFNITSRYNNTYKSFIKILRQLLNNYNITLNYNIHYIYSTYEMIYFIKLPLIQV